MKMYQIWIQYYCNVLLQMAVNNQLFASMTQEKSALTQTTSCITGHSKQFQQHKVKNISESQNKLISKQTMKSLITGMSTSSLQASCASPSHASNQVPDGSLG